MMLCKCKKCANALKRRKMETRVAIIGIIVEERDSVEKLNEILHDYAKYIIGRMGLPYHKKNISIISVVIDAEQDVINTLSGKIGNLKGISSKVVYSNV
jgi:putative iron-only hydrogenase system regulator